MARGAGGAPFSTIDLLLALSVTSLLGKLISDQLIPGKLGFQTGAVLALLMGAAYSLGQTSKNLVKLSLAVASMSILLIRKTADGGYTFVDFASQTGGPILGFAGLFALAFFGIRATAGAARIITWIMISLMLLVALALLSRYANLQ